MQILLRRKYILFPIALLLVLITTNCRGTSNELFDLYPGSYPIDPIFIEFYEKLGGENVLGPAISPIFSRDGTQYQYTVTSLMVHDTHESPPNDYHLAEIAIEWGIEEPPELASGKPHVPYLNGHNIWEEVLPYYSQHGAIILGEPLTGVVFNEEKGRYEQYLENVGFYRFEDDPEGQVHLLPYGAWMCAGACDFEIEDAIPNRQDSSLSGEAIHHADSVFLEISERLGFDFTGYPLSDTYIASDGNFEKVFANVVLFSNPQNPTKVYLRPLPLLLGINPEPPVPPTDENGIYFYPTQDNLGYNVPEPFMYYITAHGTMEVSGPPITEYHAIDTSLSKQCFSNICLEYHPNAPEDLHIRPSALGQQYQSVNQQQDVGIDTPQPTGMIGVQVWERYPLLPTNQMQEIGAAIYDNNLPLKGVEFTLVVTMPDGSQRTYYMPPTGDNGQSIIQLESIVASNGTVIPYQVCIIGLVEIPVCVIESFVLWDSP
jgi:hypothetical protein